MTDAYPKDLLKIYRAPIKHKIVLLGDQAVGKSSIINRYIYNIFQQCDHRPTIGIDFISHSLYVNETLVKLQLWDTAGQQRFRALIPNYIRDSAVAIIVYDISKSKTFIDIQKWIKDAKSQRGQSVIVALVGNKIDLGIRQIQKSQVIQIAQKHNVIARQVSAKTGQGIQDLFKQITQELASKCEAITAQLTERCETIDNLTSSKDTIDVVYSRPIKLAEIKQKKNKHCCSQ